MSTSAMTRRPRTFEDVLKDVGGRPPVAAHSSERLFKWYAQASDRKLALARALTVISKREFGHDLTLPTLPTAPAAVAAGHEGAPLEALSSRMEEFDHQPTSTIQQCPYFGRAEYAGQRECVVNYFDASKTRGLLETVHQIRGHEHHLVQVRERKLTDRDVKLPPKQRRIIGALPKSVYPQVRVITGMLVLIKQQDAATIRRPTVIKTTGQQVGAAIRRYGPEAVKGVAGGAVAAGAVLGIGSLISTIASGIASAGPAVATAAVVAVSDPALVLGDLVISGWIETEE